MATVLHVVERYLDVSSGFVHAQISRSRHHAAVLSVQPVVNRDAFPVGDASRVAALPVRGLPARVARGLVVRHARQVKAELAHAHFGYALPYTRVLKRRARLPVVVSLHGHDATGWAAANAWAYEPPPGLVDAVIVPSGWLAARAALLGFAESQIRVIPSGVDTTFFTPTPVVAEPVVAFVGRLVEKKGVTTLMAAWPQVRAAVPDAQLRVLGDGPLAPIVIGPGVSRVLPDAATRHEQVRAALASARVVATPSQTAADGDAESLLLVNLEAQAAGRPVVSTRHGGIPEFVAEGDSALLVAEGSAGELADALIQVLRDDALATRLATAGPAVAAQFDQAAMARRVDDLYDEVLSR